MEACLRTWLCGLAYVVECERAVSASVVSEKTELTVQSTRVVSMSGRDCDPTYCKLCMWSPVAVPE